MHPVLFTLPNGFAIHTYGVMLALAILVPIYIVSRWGKERGLPRDFGPDLALIVFGGAIVGSRLEYVRTNWSRFSGNLLEVFNLRDGGLVFYGGLIFVVGTLVLYLRYHKLRTLMVLDLIAPALPLGQALGRVGCFSAGCCYGREAPAGLPWAVEFSDPLTLAPTGVHLHPTQLYEVAYTLALVGLLLWMRKRQRFEGQLFLTYFSVYPIMRSINETFRADIQRGYFLEDSLGQVLTNAQAISLALLAAVAVGWWYLPRLDARRKAELDISR